MTAVLDQPRQTKLIPQKGESQADFVSRGNRALYSKIPDATKRTRYILKAWRESGRDRELYQRAAERFPQAEFQTVYDLPIFPEHRTIGGDGKVQVYDRNKLQDIVDACNRRILDTGDFAVLSGGHVPDDPTSLDARIPETMGYQGPFRLGMIGNVKPKWCIFTDEHQRRDKIEELKHLPRRSVEVWHGDNIIDPVAALGAETPRLDTGMTRYCRLTDGRTITKYSATFPSGANTSPQSFKKDRESYAAGDREMDANDDTAMRNLTDADIKAVVAELLESKPLQWVQSQMPPDWSPEEPAEGEMPGEETPDAGAPDDGAPDEGLSEGVPGDDEPSDADPAPQAETAGDGDEPPRDVGATTATDYPEPDQPEQPQQPEDAATDAELSEMDDEDKGRYAAHDSAGRKGFLQAWRKHHAKKQSNTSAGGDNCMPTTERTGKPDGYSRLQAENKQLREQQTKQQEQINQLEARNRHRERYSKLFDLRKQHAFDLKAEHEETKDITDDQFAKHCDRIKANYSRIPVGENGFSHSLHIEEPDELETEASVPGKPDKYSRRAKEIADAELKANPKCGISWDQAMAKARQEIDGTAGGK